jgi:hypothetical protein
VHHTSGEARRMVLLCRALIELAQLLVTKKFKSSRGLQTVLACRSVCSCQLRRQRVSLAGIFDYYCSVVSHAQARNLSHSQNMTSEGTRSSSVTCINIVARQCHLQLKRKLALCHKQTTCLVPQNTSQAVTHRTCCSQQPAQHAKASALHQSTCRAPTTCSC